MLKAIQQIDKEIPEDVKFYFCGDVGEEAVRQAVATLCIGHRIAHIGWIDGGQKRDIMSKTMINCLPSYHEGLPMTILETMAAGIPNISTRIASIPEVIADGENGFLIQPGNIAALSERLKQLINDEKLRLQFSQSSFELISSKLSLDEHIHKLQKLYSKIAYGTT